jgi:hypothetical protein
MKCENLNLWNSSNIIRLYLSPDWALLSIRRVTNTFIGSWVEFPDVTDRNWVSWQICGWNIDKGCLISDLQKLLIILKITCCYGNSSRHFDVDLCFFFAVYCFIHNLSYFSINWLSCQNCKLKFIFKLWYA